MDNMGFLGMRGRTRGLINTSPIKAIHVIRDSAQSIPINTANADPTPVQFTGNTYNYGWTVNGNGAIVVPKGVDHVFLEGYNYWAVRSGGYREYSFLIDGVPYARKIVASPSYADCYTICWNCPVTEGQTITLGLRNNSGSTALNTSYSHLKAVGISGFRAIKTAYATRATSQSIPKNVSPYPIYPINLTAITSSGPDPWTLDGNGYLVIPKDVNFILGKYYLRWASASSGGQYSWCVNGAVHNSSYISPNTSPYVFSPDSDNFEMETVMILGPGVAISPGVRSSGVGSVTYCHVKVIGFI